MEKPLHQSLTDHICLYASFDRGYDADFSRGDRRATFNSNIVRYDPRAGRGGALIFSARDQGWTEDELVYTAQDNFPYRESAFDGTISLWLHGDPDADLSPEYPVDLFHISRHPADGSFYLDLTRPDDERYGAPRKLRLGMYGDNSKQDKLYGGQLVVVGELGWSDRRWHHVVATWENANSSRCSAALYIDGRRRGWLEGFPHRLTWDMSQLAIGIGQRYVGQIDELLVLDIALSPEQVRRLYGGEVPLPG